MCCTNCLLDSWSDSFLAISFQLAFLGSSKESSLRFRSSRSARVTTSSKSTCESPLPPSRLPLREDDVLSSTRELRSLLR